MEAHPSDNGSAPALSNAVILIVRHAEKPASGPELTPAGQARANAYPGFLNNLRIDGQPLKLDQLFAASDTKESQRPRLTLEPTSAMLDLPINGQFEDDQYKELAEEIRSKPHGQNILICWHHGEIPQLIKAFGGEPDRLLPKGAWPNDVFNWMIALRYDSEGRLVAAERVIEPF
jgi:broad specificity phosphatase PhoE